MTRPDDPRQRLADIDAELARLDARMRPYGNLDDAPSELLDRLAALYRERDFALSAEGAKNEERPQEAA